ncbi:heterokaryon incompatibility protein-domain-containing protein [Dichomitus squalens]|uniref:Heterokaryon incompatibility protein-domain-containing protein n=1 Tax=Dichomitus squalens TaxID=114155 RepID=A0A4Q9MI25_9APHY|nr:heterokaryon incompatibility protein-domain-containing protein [Dichomitus squalens]
MRLLNTRTGVFQWVEDPHQFHYAILSHVWATPPDVSAPLRTSIVIDSSLASGESVVDKLPDKIKRLCCMAAADGFKWGWVDTCCIDKTSSSELSEAINSMFSWYGYSGACYAFLHDVPSRLSGTAHDREWRDQFCGSRWFKRGWTLQELIAPRIVVFVSRNEKHEWVKIGSKHSLAPLISEVTGIEPEVLTLEQELEQIPVARRMSWAQSRETTRLEDEAYCLMGIFGVNMQTNYGEGRYAFIRLQQEIISQNPDQSIFAWGRCLDPEDAMLSFHPPHSSPPTSSVASPKFVTVAPAWFLKQYLLASSPKDFDHDNSAHIQILARRSFEEKLGITIPSSLYQEFEITQHGVRTQFPLIVISTADSHPNAATRLAILACEVPSKGILCLLLRPLNPPSVEFFAGALVRPTKELAAADDSSSLWSDYYYRTTYIRDLASLYTRNVLPLVTGTRITPEVKSVYIPHSPSRTAIEFDRDIDIYSALREIKEEFHVVMCPWSKSVLEHQGYNVTLSRMTDQSPSALVIHSPHIGKASTINITTTKDGPTRLIACIKVGRCHCELGQSRGALSISVTSSYSAEIPDMTSRGPHKMDDGMHIQSWTLRQGSASKQMYFSSAPHRRFVLRLTFTTLALRSTPRTFQLAAEIRELPENEEKEMIGPKLPSASNLTTSGASPTPASSASDTLPAPSSTPSTHIYVMIGFVTIVSLLTNLTLGLLLMTRLQ